jgi:hypothetical protein
MGCCVNTAGIRPHQVIADQLAPPHPITRRRATASLWYSQAEYLREALVEIIVGKMPDAHRRFLVSFEGGKPEWPLLGIPKAADLSAVKWRQHKLDKLSDKNALRSSQGQKSPELDSVASPRGSGSTETF